METMARVAKRIVVRGRVQQVGFRDWTVRHAKALSITGWVRNRRDGSVEIHAVGDDEAIDRLIEACREGPPLARVDAIEPTPDLDVLVKGFTKRFGA